MEAESTEGAAGEKIRELTEEFRATFRPNLLTNNTTPSIPMKDLVEFLVPGDGLLENTRKRSKAKAKKDYHELAGGEGSLFVEGSTQSESSDSGHSSSGDEDSDDEAEDGFCEQSVVDFLRGLQPFIEARHNVRPLTTIPGLRSTIVPHPHQMKAAAAIVQADQSKFKGLILADPPGFGKTLMALMAIATTPREGLEPSVVVAPTSCRRQWGVEAQKYFEKVRETERSVTMALADTHQGKMKVLSLAPGEKISPLELYKYDVVLISYEQARSELTRINKYLEAVHEYKAGKTEKLPTRPHVTLLSGIFDDKRGLTILGKFLILDEAHVAKNPDGKPYEALQHLRARFDTCIMMTGTPLDNTWIDSYALLSMMRNHPITSLMRMGLAFTSSQKGDDKTLFPPGHHATRLIQMLDAVTVRRPVEAIASLLPDIRTMTVKIQLHPHDRAMSNACFKEYRDSMAFRGKDKKKSTKMSKSEKKKSKDVIGAAWAALVKAQQEANHPMLTEIMRLERDSLLHGIQHEESLDAVHEEDDEEMLLEWRDKLKRDEKYRSARVDAVLDVINRHRDVRPTDTFLLLDESVYFLDIIEIAISEMYEPLPCFRYDGRKNAAERFVILDNFFRMQGPRIMLASRGTGGQALNVQCANVMIRCGPWWKKAWEKQGDGRCFRAGQEKPVFIYEITATGCDVESYKCKIRDRKSKHNDYITNRITRLDDVELPRARRIY